MAQDTHRDPESAQRPQAGGPNVSWRDNLRIIRQGPGKRASGRNIHGNRHWRQDEISIEARIDQGLHWEDESAHGDLDRQVGEARADELRPAYRHFPTALCPTLNTTFSGPKVKLAFS